MFILNFLILHVWVLADEKICDIRFKDGMWKKYVILDINWNGVEGVEYNLYKNTPNPDAVFISRDDIDYILCDTAITLPLPPPSLRSQQLLSSLDSSLSTMRHLRVGGGIAIIRDNEPSVRGGLGFNIYIDYEIADYLIFSSTVGHYTGNYSFLWIEESILFPVFWRERGERTGIIPYIGGGVGYYIIDDETDPSLHKFVSDSYYITKQRIENIFGPHVRVGFLLYVLNGKISINTDMKYVIIEPKRHTSLDLYVYSPEWVTPSIFTNWMEDRDEIDLKTLFFNIGLTINF